MKRSKSWWVSGLTLATLCAAFATLPGCSCGGGGSADDDDVAGAGGGSAGGGAGAGVGAGGGPAGGGPAGGGPTECSLGPQGGLCVQGRCRVQVPGQAVTGDIQLRVQERPAAEAMAADSVGGFVCEVGPAELSLSWQGSLLVSYAAGDVPAGFGAGDLVGFRQQGGRQTLVAGSGVEAEAGFVRVPFASAGTFGATAVPRAAAAGAQIGVDTLRVYDAASLARNLSSAGMLAAFYDGRRLYVGSGSRLLIWNDGVPADPSKAPDVVVGKADLVDARPAASASNFSGPVKGIWSDGERLVVAEGNRVLVWKRVPAQSGQPADLVLGQDGMSATAANGGGSPGPATLADPDEVASDGTRLVVSDAGNHRVLVWNAFPQYNRQPADVVIGQESFDDGVPGGGAIKLVRPRGLYFDGQRLLVTSTGGPSSAFGLSAPPAQNNPYADFQVGADTAGLRAVTDRVFPMPAAMSGFGAGGLALRDRIGMRASVWREMPASAATPSSFAVGRPDRFVGGNEVGGVSASTFTSSDERAGLFADGGLMLAPDDTRLLVWRSLPGYDGAPADLVLGQPSFVTAQRAVDYRGVGRETLSHPAGVYEAEGVRVVADRANDRVLVTRVGGGAPAVVVGQPSAESYAPNGDWRSPSAATLNAPEDALVEGGRLFVADAGNHRVLVWNSLPDADGRPADLVIGQADFAGTRPNRGAADLDGDGDSDAGADGFFYPSGLAVDGDKLFVSDAANHRVLVFSPLPGSNGAEASAVFGQADFAGNEPNRGQGWFKPQADGLAWPAGLGVDPASGQLWVADRENNRAVAFATRPSLVATAVAQVGQPNLTTNAFPSFYSNGLNNGVALPEAGVGDTTLRRPGDVAVAGGRLWVSDAGRNRVLGFALPLGAAPAAASAVLGQPTFATGAPNGDGLGPRSLKAPRGLAAVGDGLLVADAENHRVLAYAAPGPGNVAASGVEGQHDFLTNGENRSAPAFGTLDRPTGVAWDGELLWVADRDNHRLLAYRDPDAADAPAALVLGQVDFARALANAGRPVGRDTLNGPTDVATDGARLAVADRDNHRVLLWHRVPRSTSEPPDVVIGQPDFDSGKPNAGAGLGAPSAATLSAPEGVALAGGKLYVADTGNHRVLVFDALPAANGAAADRVLCQADFAGNLGNRGEPDAAADRCSWPTDVLPAGDRLYVADSLNHRVLRFAAAAPNGAAAAGVVGQRDFVTRAPSGADGKSDAKTLNSPTSVEFDGVNLFVTDAGNHRVLVFRPLPDGTGEEEAAAVLGQPTFATSAQTTDYGGLGQPSRVVALPRPFHSTRLFVADTAKNRVLVFDNVLRIEGER